MRKHILYPITHTAGDTKRGMTVAELRVFMADVDNIGVADDTRVEIVSTWRSTIKEITVKAEKP